MVRERQRLSKSEKISKKLRGIQVGVGKVNANEARYICNIVALVPTEVNGFLVKRLKKRIIFRHKKSSASKKMRLSIINNSDIISLFGDVGETSQLVMMKRKTIGSYSGKVSIDGGGNLLIQDEATDEVVTLYNNPGVEVEIYADEEFQDFKPSTRRKEKPERNKDDDLEEDDELDGDEEIEPVRKTNKVLVKSVNKIRKHNR